MANPANITRAFVRGTEVSRDHDLSAERTFEFRTDRGNFYRVVAGESRWDQTWTVTKLEDGQEVAAGTVRHAKLLLIFGTSAHRYVKPGAAFSSGSQNDLWNAVQSLAV